MFGTFVEENWIVGGVRHPRPQGTASKADVLCITREPLILVRSEGSLMMIANVHLDPYSTLKELRNRLHTIRNH